MGTLINMAAILVGGLLGVFLGKAIPRRLQDSLYQVCGVSVLFIGMGGALSKMLVLTERGFETQGTMRMLLCLILGALLGELLNIQGAVERLGLWLRKKSRSEGDSRFLDAFLTASLTVCIGAMAIVGAIRDGIQGDYSTLAVKAVLDFIIVAVMTSTLGKGSAFSAIPVFLFEGAVTLLAKLIAPALTDLAVAYLSLIGSVLIFCVGVNLVWGKQLRVANMLPAVLLAILAAYLPWSF